MDENQIFHNILVAIEIFSLVLLGFTVIFAYITKLIKKEACAKVLSVLCVICLALVPVIMHLIIIYITQNDKSAEGIMLNFTGSSVYHLTFVPIICFLNPLVTMKCISIAMQVKKLSQKAEIIYKENLQTEDDE